MNLRKPLSWILVAFLTGNGCFMLVAPEAWYHLVKTVPFTGPFNQHFVRDIGAAYLVCGGAMLWLTLGRAGGGPAALTGGIFLLLHALIHLWDAAAGRETLEHLAEDFVGVVLVPLLALWLAWPRKTTS